MLIHVSDSVVEQALDDDANALSAIENLLCAHREGKHIACFEPASLRKVGGLAPLSRAGRGTAQAIFARLTEILSLRKSLNVHLSIQTAPTTAGSVQAIPVPVALFADSARSQRTPLIAENITDGSVYRALAEAYLVAQRWKGLRISADLRNGGGSTTGPVFEAICASGLPCLCIVDSDRKFPGDSLGDTARDVCAGRATASPFQHLLILNVRELENLFPLSALRVVLTSSVPSPFAAHLDRLALCEARINSGWRSHVDLKAGLCGGDITRQFNPGSPGRAFWTAFADEVRANVAVPNCACDDGGSCGGRPTCTAELVMGFGNGLLATIAQWLDNTSAHKAAEALGEATSHGELAAVASHVVAWCCAYPASIT